ncbi:phytanoyl-CoA dioxygenase family protein [Lacimicrobium alkaliphilum]|uniref:phytanoyl-CoA dioxygenase family protein n=1 Tax=Lacimicrobium alkaliphilum TaxID=1526571 RepID=UPI000BFF0913|nr:phytanoyl-CoA dioxygenase family protein [Lacimicrobium alkaliphilum]
MPDAVEAVLERVRYFGLCMIPEYYSHQFCEQAVGIIRAHEANRDVDIWRDAQGSDTRIMGIEAFQSELDIRKDVLVGRVIASLYGQPPGSGFITSGHLLFRPGNLGSGGGWHRDSVHSDQFKALVYLTDVNSDNGPFQYYLNTSSENSLAELEEHYDIPVTENRISCDPTSVLPVDRLVEVCGPAGSLIISNTRGIHRGKPIQSNERFSLTSYHWKGGIPAHIDKLVNKSCLA